MTATLKINHSLHDNGDWDERIRATGWSRYCQGDLKSWRLWKSWRPLCTIPYCRHTNEIIVLISSVPGIFSDIQIYLIVHDVGDAPDQVALLSCALRQGFTNWLQNMPCRTLLHQTCHEATYPFWFTYLIYAICQLLLEILLIGS